MTTPTSMLKDLRLSHLPNNDKPCSPPHARALSTYWSNNYKSPLANHNAMARLPQDAVDIAIIGSGLTAAFALYHLVDRVTSLAEADKTRSSPISIVILEAREFCSGATSRNGGHLTSSPILSFESLAETLGVEEALRHVQMEQASIDLILDLCAKNGWENDVDLVKGGSLHLFEDREEMERVRRSVEMAEREGVDVQGHHFLSQGEVDQQFGTKGLVGALQIPGNNLYPLKFVTKLVQHTMDRVLAAGERSPINFKLFTQCRVDKVVRSQVKDSRSVIYCTNGYSSYLVPSLARGALRIIPTRGQVAVVNPTASSNPHWTNSFASPHQGEHYFFQRPQDGAIILGGARSTASSTNYEFGSTDDSSINPTIGEALRRYLPEQFPGIFTGMDAMDIGEEWTGVMAYTETGFPLVGPLFESSANGRKTSALSGQYISAGYSGHGMPRAPGCGCYLAELVLEEIYGHQCGEKQTNWNRILPTGWKSTQRRWEEHLQGLPHPKMSPMGFWNSWCSLQ